MCTIHTITQTRERFNFAAINHGYAVRPLYAEPRYILYVGDRRYPKERGGC